MLHETAVMKIFHQNPTKSSKSIKKAKDYACPEGTAFIEVKGRIYLINVPLDSGSNIFLMNQDTALRREIPTGGRAPRLKITTFDGETASTGGTFYTHPILLEVSANSPQSMISCEIAHAEDRI